MDYEEIIGQALITGDHETGIRRSTCKLAASHRMFCGCGAIHDQRKVHVVEIVHADKQEETIAALCPACYEKNAQRFQEIVDRVAADYRAANVAEPPVLRVATWKQYITFQPTN